MADNVNELHEASVTKMERMAIWITDHVGSFGFFLIIVAWTLAWLGWNTLGPKTLRFDPAPVFLVWLFLSNILQILLMPLLMVGQTLQNRHAELRADNEYKTTLLIERETGDMQQHLHRMEARQEELFQQLQALTDRLAKGTEGSTAQ